MEQPSYKMLKDIEYVLKAEISDKTLFDDLVSKLSVIIKDYEIGDKCYAMVPYADENIQILDRYRACMMVEGKSPATIEQYLYRLNHMYTTCKIDLKSMGPYDIRFYLAICKRNGCCNRTLESIRAYISAFYKWMTYEGMIEKNPCVTIKPIKYTEEIKEAFSELEVEKLRANCKSVKERAIIEMLLSTGVRISELEMMNRDDLDFTSNAVHVKHGKGDKERLTYMSPVAAYYMFQYLNSRKDSANEIFQSNSKTRMNSGGYRFLLHSIGKRADVTNVHPHRFRRTFATNLNNKGMAIQHIQQLLGHTKLDTTMIYVNVDNRAVKSEYVKYMAS